MTYFFFLAVCIGGENLCSLTKNDLITIYFFPINLFINQCHQDVGPQEELHHAPPQPRSTADLPLSRFLHANEAGCVVGHAWTPACLCPIYTHQYVMHNNPICVAKSLNVFLMSQATPDWFWIPRGQTSSATALTTTSTCSTSVGSKPLQVNDDPNLSGGKRREW